MFILTCGGDDDRQLWRMAATALRGVSTTQCFLVRCQNLEGMQVEESSISDLEDFAYDRSNIAYVSVVGEDMASLTFCRPLSFANEFDCWTFSLESSDLLVLSTYATCLRETHPQFVALSVDDDPAFEGRTVDADTFPWSWYLLVRGAVRRVDGTWDERAGPLTLRDAEQTALEIAIRSP